MLNVSAQKVVLIVIYILYPFLRPESQNINTHTHTYTHTHTHTHNQPSSEISNKTLLMVHRIQIIRTPNKNIGTAWSRHG